MATQHTDDTTQQTGQPDPNLLEGEDLIVEVEDDTPEPDKGRKPLETDPLTQPDPLAEAQGITKNVEKRIKELTRKGHDERRAKEAMQRERDESLKLLREAMARTRQLEQRLAHGEVAFSQETTSKAQLALDAARAKYERAFEAGDAKGQAEATAEIAAAAQELNNAKAWNNQATQRQKTALQTPEKDVDSEQNLTQGKPQGNQPQPEAASEATLTWAAANPWFQTNRRMTSYAYGLHASLVEEEGLHPDEDADEYYARIDKEMRLRFPEYPWEDGSADKAKPATPPAARKPATVVAPVTRVSTGQASNKVTLKASEIRIAESLGLTPQQYAREKQKLLQAQGE